MKGHKLQEGWEFSSLGKCVGSDNNLRIAQMQKSSQVHTQMNRVLKELVSGITVQVLLKKNPHSKI